MRVKSQKYKMGMSGEVGSIYVWMSRGGRCAANQTKVTRTPYLIRQAVKSGRHNSAFSFTIVTGLVLQPLDKALHSAVT